MKFLKSIIKTNDPPVRTYAEFWDWFEYNNRKFYRLVKHKGPIRKVFLHPLSEKLNQLKSGFWFLVGMDGDKNAELIITADGVIKNIPFAEDLVAQAPEMGNWKITALKQPTDIKNVCIKLEGLVFDDQKIQFYPNVHKQMPDEIDMTITHQDYSEKTKDIIKSGVFLALDHFLGELNSVTTIDNVNIIHPKDAKKELIPLERLKSYLVWREKEFIEKYEGLRYHEDMNAFAALEAKLHNGLPLLATINTGVLGWENKASHPWIAEVNIYFNTKNESALPNDDTCEQLQKIEDIINSQLKVDEGYINIGRETADSVRTIFFAGIEFRKLSRVLYNIQKNNTDTFKIDYNIYKDKYWQTFNSFRPKL